MNLKLSSAQNFYKEIKRERERELEDGREIHVHPADIYYVGDVGDIRIESKKMYSAGWVQTLDKAICVSQY